MREGIISRFVTSLVNPLFQVGAIVTMSIILSALFYNSLSKFITLDKVPELYHIVPQKMQSKNATEVLVGLYITNFPTFDIVNNNFIADAIVWFKFDPAVITLSTISQFSFERGVMLSKSEPDTKVINESVLAQYRIRLQFTTNLNHTFFPLSDHRISIVLTNNFVSPQGVIFKTSSVDFNIAPEIRFQEWIPINKSVDMGYSQVQLNIYNKNTVIANPKVIFIIDCAKAGYRRAFVVILPLIILFYLGIFTLSFDPRTLARSILALSVGVITGLLAYRFVLERIIPDVAYFTLADHLFNLFLALGFIMFLISSYGIKVGSHTQRVLIIKGLTIIFCYSIVLYATYYLLYAWIY